MDCLQCKTEKIPRKQVKLSVNPSYSAILLFCTQSRNLLTFTASQLDFRSGFVFVQNR